jgi:hypothetical protein
VNHARWFAGALALTLACHSPSSGIADDASAPVPLPSVDRLRHVDSIVYTDGQLAFGPAEELTVGVDGTLHYESHTNVLRPAQQDIGTYETTASTASLGELESLVSSLETLPDHTGKLAFDDRVRQIRATIDGRTVTKSVGASTGPVDRRLEQIMDRLDAVARTTLASPLRAVHVELEQAAVDRRGTFEVRAVFSNQGRQTVRCRAPPSLVGRENDLLAIDSWPDPEPNGIAPWRSPVSRVDEVSRTGSAAAKGDLLELPPGASVSYRLQGKLAEPADRPLVLQLVYRNLETPADGAPVLLTGELRATAKAVVPR